MALRYGYVSTFKPPKTTRPQTGGLALAAAGQPSPTNPFGFQTARNTTGYDRAPAAAPLTPHRPVSAATSPVAPPVTRPAVNPTVAQPQTTAPTPGGYDITTDPSLQQTNIDTGVSDEAANAQALKERQNLAVGYGSGDLARALGLGDTIAAAAAGNPTSTLAQLGQQHDRNTRDLTEQLNAANLLYSGYRVLQEQRAAQDYENQLSGAAGGVNSSLDTVSGNLASTLSANQQQRLAAEQAARDRAVQAALATGGPGGTTGADTTAGSGSAGAAAPIPSPTAPPSTIADAISQVAATAPTTDYSFLSGIGGSGGAAAPIPQSSLFASPQTLDALTALLAPSSQYGSTAQRRRQAL